MAKTKTVRVRIINYLRDKGDSTTADIFDALNDNTSKYGLRSGVTTNQLNNVLGKEPLFIKTIHANSFDAPIITSMGGNRYKVSTWALNESILKQYPEMLNRTANTWKVTGLDRHVA
tara:strand:+ start:5961 stop:6311 length:351 start_codon:yes stop_codon:yes gene_type:complete